MNKRKVKIVFTSLIGSMFLGLTSCGDSHVHTFSPDWSHDETNHWHEATCGHNVKGSLSTHTFTSEVIAPTYEERGYTHHVCTVCEYSYDDQYVDPKEHNYSSTYSFDDYHHWRACTDEGYENLYTDYQEHVLSADWIIDEAATEHKKGHRHKNCSTCSYKLEEDYELPVKAERVYVSASSADLFNGYTYTINPAISPYNAYKNIKYAPKDSIIEVNGNTALAKGEGSTLVYIYNDENDNDAKDEGEAFAVMSFNITNPDPSKRVIVQDSAVIKVGESLKLTYSAENISTYGTDYGFYSEDQSICTISGGKVKGHRPGKTRISVSLQGYRAYCDVTVENNIDSTGLRAYEIDSPKNVLLNKGESKTLSYSILPSESVDTLLSVESNNEEVVKVNADKSITAVKGGTARIKLTTSNNKYTFVLVTVKEDVQITDSYYNNYYGDLTWENTDDLINKLHTIISTGVTPLRYAGTPANWESNQMADQDLYNHSYVNCVYIDDPLLKSNTNTGWQREHAFAATLMCGYSSGTAVTALGRATDFHNLYAAGGGANGSRGNKNLGYATPESAELEKKENCIYDKKTFEPADEDKGKLARALLYMSIMYKDNSSVDISEPWTFRGDDITNPAHGGKASKTMHAVYEQQGLKLVNENVDYSKISLDEFMAPKDSNVTIVNYYRSLVAADYPTLEEDDYDEFRFRAYEYYLERGLPYAIGNVKDIIEWNSFPVSLNEMQHNISVYSDYSSIGKGTQGNRNPFVDYPQLVEYIYGDLRNEPGSLKELIPSYLTLEMDKDEIHHYAVESDSIPAFESGTKPKAEDFNIKAIKNDLSEGVLDISKISVEDYTFTDDDVETGKVITIETDLNTLKVPCKVTSKNIPTFDTSSWKFESEGASSDYSKVKDGQWFIQMSDVDFDVLSSNNAVTLGNRPSSKSVRFGSNSVYCTKLTFASQNEFSYKGQTKINAVFFSIGFGNSIKANYIVKIGSTTVLSGTCKGATPTIYGGYWSTPIEGIVTIEFSGVTAYADVHGFAINTVA